MASSGKHVKKSKVVKLLLAHTGLDLALIDDEWYMVCECDARAHLKDRDALAQTEWHARHIVNIMNEKGMLR